MGFFDEDERKTIHNFTSSPAALQAVSDEEVEAWADVYWEDPDELDEVQERAVRHGAKAIDESGAEKLGKSYAEEVPSILEKL